MTDVRRRLLSMVDAERDALIVLLSRLVKARSPNPPGDTRAAAAVLADWLAARNISYRVVGPDATMPNLLASFQGARPGPHLVLNGHIDTFRWLPLRNGPTIPSVGRLPTAQFGERDQAT